MQPLTLETSGDEVDLRSDNSDVESEVVKNRANTSFSRMSEQTDIDGDDGDLEDSFEVKGEKEGPKQNSIVTIFTIWNTMMGTSILAMPWALAQAGLGFGIFLILAVAGLACYTAYLAIQTTEDIRFIKNIPSTVYMDISDAVAFHWGKAGRIIALIFSQVSLIGASIVYFVLLSNFLYYTVEYIYLEATDSHPPREVTSMNGKNFTDVVCIIGGNFSSTTIENEWYNKLWVLDRTVPAWLLIVLIPLVSIKSPTFLGKFTFLATVSVVYLLILIIVKGSSWGVNMGVDNEVINISAFFPSLTGTCSLAFYIHNALQTVLRTQKKPENNARDIIIAFSFTTLTYAIIGIAFYIIFPLTKNCIADNLLNNLVTDIPVFIARMFLFIQMSVIYPMLVYILRAQIMYAIFKDVYPSWRHVLVLHTIVLALGLLFAIVYPSIGTIIRFIGALCGFVYIFTIPPMIALLNKRILGMVTTPTLEMIEQSDGNEKFQLPLHSEPTIQWRDRQTMIWWWVRCAFYIVIVLLGLLNFIAQFVLLGF